LPWKPKTLHPGRSVLIELTTKVSQLAKKANVGKP
jgi:hypothetical protein